MTPFTALDEVLTANTTALAPAADRTVAPAAGFQPLFAQALTPAAETRPVPAAAPDCEPQVETVIAEGRVQQIIVTCRCGERTVIECAY